MIAIYKSTAIPPSTHIIALALTPKLANCLTAPLGVLPDPDPDPDPPPYMDVYWSYGIIVPGTTGVETVPTLYVGVYVSVNTIVCPFISVVVYR